MSKVPYIVSAAAFVLVAVFAIFERFWSGLVYFVIGTLLLLSLFWGVWLIITYCTTYKHQLDEKFLIYKAEVINQQHITLEYFEENKRAFKKEFDKKMARENFSRIYMIIFCFALAIAFLIAMIYI